MNSIQAVSAVMGVFELPNMKAALTPTTRFSLLAGILMTLGIVGWVSSTDFAWYWGYLLSVNLVVYGLCSYDKWIASGTRTRVPERVLLGSALIGGSPGLLLAMYQWRHKTQKASFRWPLWGAILLQLALIGTYGYIRLFK